MSFILFLIVLCSRLTCVRLKLSAYVELFKSDKARTFESVNMITFISNLTNRNL